MLGNDVLPDEAFVYPKTPLALVTATRTTLYAEPDATSAAAGTVESGQTLQADGISADGNWVRVAFDSEGRYGTIPFAWVSLESVEDTDVRELAVHEAENYTPMQRFVFKNTTQEDACRPTPAAMVMVQSPDETETRFVVNGADVLIASTVVFTIRQPNIMELRVLAGTAAVCVGTPNEFAIPEGFAIEIPLSMTKNIGDQTFAATNLCGWTNLRLMLEDEIRGFSILEAFLDNILNVLVRLPRIDCPSGVGQPICSVVIQNPIRLERIRRLCASGIITPAICARIRGL
jgi:hypothetical protein